MATYRGVSTPQRSFIAKMPAHVPENLRKLFPGRFAEPVANRKARRKAQKQER